MSEEHESNYCYHCKFDGKRQMVIIANLRTELAELRKALEVVQDQIESALDDNKGNKFLIALKFLFEQALQKEPKGGKDE